MNTPPRLVTRSVAALLFVFAALPVVATAQAVIAPPVQLQKSAAQRANSRTTELKGNSDVTSAFPDGLPLLRRGPVALRPHLHYRFIQADGIHATPVLSVDTTIQEISPALMFEIGKHWTLHYAPTWTIYSNEFFRDSFDQSVTLAGSGSHGRWDFGGSQGYTVSNTTLIETGGQTHQTLTSTSANVGYQLGEHARATLDVNRGDRQVDAVDNDPQWTTANWLQWSGTGWFIYQYSKKFTAGVGATVGYDEISGGADMSYTRPQMQLTWQPGEKVSVHVQAGVERRQVEGGNRKTMNNPVYSGSLEYQPVKTTKLIGTVGRSISASYYDNRAIRSDSWQAAIQQRLLQKFYLTCDVSEGETTYLVTGSEKFAGEILGRDDVSRSFRAKLSAPFLRRGSMAVFYQVGRNKSDIQRYVFKTDQFGFEADYSF